MKILQMHARAASRCEVPCPWREQHDCDFLCIGKCVCSSPIQQFGCRHVTETFGSQSYNLVGRGRFGLPRGWGRKWQGQSQAAELAEPGAEHPAWPPQDDPSADGTTPVFAPEGCPRCSPCHPRVRGVIGPTHGAGARGCFPLGRIPLAVRPREERAVSQGDFHLNAPWQNALRKLLTPRGKL